MREEGRPISSFVGHPSLPFLHSKTAGAPRQRPPVEVNGSPVSGGAAAVSFTVCRGSESVGPLVRVRGRNQRRGRSKHGARGERRSCRSEKVPPFDRAA